MPGYPDPLAPGGAQPPDPRLEVRVVLNRELAAAQDARAFFAQQVALAGTPVDPRLEGGVTGRPDPASAREGLRRAEARVAGLRSRLDVLEEAMRRWP